MVVNDSKSIYHQSPVNGENGTDFSYLCLLLVDRKLVSVIPVLSFLGVSYSRHIFGLNYNKLRTNFTTAV